MGKHGPGENTDDLGTLTFSHRNGKSIFYFLEPELNECVTSAIFFIDNQQGPTV